MYAGLAAGAAPGERQVWALATAAAVLLGMRKVARLIRPARPAAPARPGNPPEDRPTGPGRALAVLAARVPALPAGERAVVITVTAAVYGTRMSLLVLTWWGAVALAWAVAGPRLGKRSSATADDAPGDARRSRPRPPSRPRVMTARSPVSRARSSAGSWCRCPPRWPG